MKKIIFNLSSGILFFLCLCYQFVYSQVAQEWTQRFNGFGWSTCMTIDKLSNVYTAGSIAGTGNNSYDFIIIKYNSSGVQQWAKTYGSYYWDAVQDIGVDDSGNVYVTGKIEHNWGNISYDFVTLKYNSSGILKWEQIYYGIGNEDNEPRAMVVDGSGNVYVTGNSYGTGASYCTTVKYNSAGVEQWVNRYSGPNNGSFSYSIGLDGFGNIYVTGVISGGAGAYNNDFLTIKYNPSGVEQWVQIYSSAAGNLSWDNAYDLIADGSGNVFVTGASQVNDTLIYSTTIKYNSSGNQQWITNSIELGTFHPDDTFIASDGFGNIIVTARTKGVATSWDYATIKYNSSGIKQWFRSYSPGFYDFPLDMSVDNFGNIYVTGESFGINNDDYATIKYNAAGTLMWIQRYDGPTHQTDYGTSVRVDVNGKVFVSGASEGNILTIKYSQQITTNIYLGTLLQGFYDNTLNKMNKDTVSVVLRNTIPPFAAFDSSKSLLDSNGNGIFPFQNAVNGTPYFIVVKHRNSIETWSKTGVMFSSNSLSYDFTSSAIKAFGNNLILKGSKYCIYSGDVNSDGYIDLTDVTLIYNNTGNFVTGYLITDLTGDNITDLTDLVIAFNNSNNFVSVITP